MLILCVLTRTHKKVSGWTKKRKEVTVWPRHAGNTSHQITPPRRRPHPCGTTIQITSNNSANHCSPEQVSSMLSPCGTTMQITSNNSANHFTSEHVSSMLSPCGTTIQIPQTTICQIFSGNTTALLRSEKAIQKVPEAPPPTCLQIPQTTMCQIFSGNTTCHGTCSSTTEGNEEKHPKRARLKVWCKTALLRSQSYSKSPRSTPPHISPNSPKNNVPEILRQKAVSRAHVNAMSDMALT